MAIGEELADHCESLLRNLKNPTRPRLVRRVINVQLDPRYAPVLIRDLEQQATTMADSMDDVLNDPLHSAKSADGALRVGIGLYIIEGHAAPESHVPDPSAGPQSGGSKRARTRRVGS
jgi:hypothetical protein